ncbi:hypothetical protein ACHAWT_000870 [Skeletonema menzelii]
MASATAALQPLRNYIRHNIGHLRATPCLLISSKSPPSVSTAVAGTKNPSSLSTDEKQQQQHKQQLKFQQQQNDPQTHLFVERNIQSIQLEFNLRTVPCTISSAFPTTDSVNEAVSLAKRFGLKEGQFGSGDGLIIGIGSGAAIDLAKAVADTLFGNISSCKDGINQQEGGSLVLAPSTLGGVVAAFSNTPSLLLDTKEEMILPHLTPSWTTALDGHCRQGTVVTIDKQLSLPPLYSPLQPPKRSESFPRPSMAHYAAAMLSILLDVARILDEHSIQQTIDTALLKDVKSVASASSLVLQLAAKEANESNAVQDGDSYATAQQHLISAIPRLSAVVDQTCHLTQGSTVPQRLANALLPQYFPSCHLVTYLASILPGLCESVATQPASNDENKVSVLEELTKSIFSCIDGGEKTDDRVSVASLVSWASQITEESAIPTMASLAYGTPDINALSGSLDSYDALVGSMVGANNGIRASNDDFALVEDVLNRSLNR